jgi:hypothetical protein
MSCVYSYNILQELHAHINGSISESTMSQLVAGMSTSYNPDSLKFKKGETGTLKE